MALAQRITAPRYIEAQRMGGFVERATDVDVVSDLMIHDIDIILSLVGSEIRNITAVGSPVLTEHVDIATAQIEFVNGTVANVVASRVSDKKMRRIRVFQPGMYLSLDFIDQTIDIAEPRPVPGAERPEIARQRIQVEPVKPLDSEIASFIACVREGHSAHRRWAGRAQGPGCRPAGEGEDPRLAVPGGDGPRPRDPLVGPLRRGRAAPSPRRRRWPPPGCPRSARSGPGQVQGRAVIHGGADDGQAQGDVDRLPEAQVLEHRQALVVIHGEHAVGLRQVRSGRRPCPPGAGR